MPNRLRTPFRRSHRITRLGFHFLFVGGFAMLGGSLRGFNLLLVLAGLLIGVLLIQWRWSRRSLAGMRVERRLPTEAFAGRPFRVRYRLTNDNRLMPAWMVRLEDAITAPARSERKVGGCGVGVISAQQTVASYFDCSIQRRGLYRFGPLTLSTTFPFSLFTVRQTVRSSSRLHVYPELLQLQPRWQRRLVSRSGGVAVTVRRGGPTEGDFFGLREWRTGDNPRWIHWRTTARIGEPAVRQFEQQRRFDTCIVVDAYRDPSAQRATDDVETAISLAASFLVHLVSSPTNRLVLAVAAESTAAVVGGGSPEGKRRMLSMLAEVEHCGEPKLSEAISQAGRIAGAAQDLIVISSRGIAAALATEPELREQIAPWNRRGSFRWINAGGPDLARWAIGKQRSADTALVTDRHGRAASAAGEHRVG